MHDCLHVNDTVIRDGKSYLAVMKDGLLRLEGD